MSNIAKVGIDNPIEATSTVAGAVRSVTPDIIAATATEAGIISQESAGSVVLLFTTGFTTTVGATMKYTYSGGMATININSTTGTSPNPAGNQCSTDVGALPPELWPTTDINQFGAFILRDNGAYQTGTSTVGRLLITTTGQLIVLKTANGLSTTDFVDNSGIGWGEFNFSYPLS